MARCPFCKEILPDAWVRKQGASLLGKAGGQTKARNNASAAAKARWAKEKAAQKPKKKSK